MAFLKKSNLLLITSYPSFEKLVSQGIFKDVFFDVNIRQNYYSEEIINTALSIATVYKASRDDLVPLGYGGNIERYCLDICNKYPNLKLVIITLDRDGAMVYNPSAKAYLYKEAYPCKVEATVGAGDSFSACFMHNYLSGKDLYTCLDRGCYMGSFVASRPEAIPNYTKELLNYVL